MFIWLSFLIPEKPNLLLIYVNKTVLHFKTFVAIPELEGKVNKLLSHLFELLTGVTFTVFHQVIIIYRFIGALHKPIDCQPIVVSHTFIGVYSISYHIYNLSLLHNGLWTVIICSFFTLIVVVFF